MSHSFLHEHQSGNVSHLLQHQHSHSHSQHQHPNIQTDTENDGGWDSVNNNNNQMKFSVPCASTPPLQAFDGGNNNYSSSSNPPGLQIINPSNGGASEWDLNSGGGHNGGNGNGNGNGGVINNNNPNPMQPYGQSYGRQPSLAKPGGVQRPPSLQPTNSLSQQSRYAGHDSLRVESIGVGNGNWTNDGQGGGPQQDFSLTAPSSPRHPHHLGSYRSGSADDTGGNMNNRQNFGAATGPTTPRNVQQQQQQQQQLPTHDAHGHPIYYSNLHSVPQSAGPQFSRIPSGANTPMISTGSQAVPSIERATSTTNLGSPGGFNGATAREFFRSHLRAIAFTARLSHLTGSPHPSSDPSSGHPSDEHGGHPDGTNPDGVGPGEMSEESFIKMAESLGKEESISTLKSMYQSLQQFRTLLVESRTLASSELQKEETFNRIVTRVRSVIQAEAVVLLMMDKQSETFYSCATTISMGQISYQHNLTHSFCGHVLRYKQSLNLKYQADKDPRYDPDLSKKLGGIKFRNILAVPIFSKTAKILAVILCINKSHHHPHHQLSSSLVKPHPKDNFFTDQDQSLVEFIALLAGHTIENALLFDEAVTRRHQTETLLQITELMAAEIDTNKVMHRMIEASYLLVNAEKITLYMIDQEKEELVALTRGNWALGSHGHQNQGGQPAPGSSVDKTASSSSSLQNPDSQQRFSMSKGILGFCATSGKPVNAPDARRDWRFDSEVDSQDDCPTISLLVVPVTDHMSKPIAIIQAVNKRVPQQTGSNAPITGGSAQTAQPLFQPASPTFQPVHPTHGHGANQAAPLAYFTKDEQALLQSMAVSAGIILRKSKLYEEAISTRKKTEALLQISELMSADLQSEKVMSKIVQAAYMLVNCECILLYMVDEAASELVCEVGKDGSKGSRLPLGHGVAGHTALTGRSLNITDAQNDWRFDPEEHSHFKNKVQTILAIPVKDYLGKNVGVIEIINKRSVTNTAVVPFSSEDEDVLNSLAYTAGAVLRKSKLFDEAISRRRQTEALLQINEIMSAEISTEKIMKRIIEASYTLVDAERITLFAVDPKTGELVCQVSKDPFFQGVRMGYGHGIVGHVALTRRSLNIVNAYSDPRFNQLSDLKTGYKTHSILTVPVTDRRGQAVAVIQAVNKRGEKAFTGEDVLLLESMAVNAGMLLQKSRLFDAAVVADRKSRALVSLVMTATREDLSTEQIMHEIGHVAYDALCADRIYIFFVDQIQEQLTCVVGPDEEGWTIQLGRGIAGYVALTGDLVNVEDAFKHSKFDPAVDVRGSYKPKSILCMGVKNNDGEVIAVVYAVNKRSAARHAQLQWAGINVQSVNTTGIQSDGRQPSLASPIRPHGGPPPPFHQNTVSTPPAGLNPYSNSLPPTASASGSTSNVPTLRKHPSHKSLAAAGGMSPWHSLRASSAAGFEERGLSGGSGSSGGDSPSNAGGMTLGGRNPSPMTLPSPMRSRSSLQLDDSPIGGALQAQLNLLQSPSGINPESEQAIEVFTSDDEEILRALCAEVRSLLIRQVREIVLEMNQLNMNEGVYSLMDMYSGTTNSRTAFAATAAHAVNQTHQTTSGLPPVPASKGVGGAPSLLRPNTMNRHAKRSFKQSPPTEHIPWPVMSQSKFSELLSLDFNVWTYSPDDLLVLSYEMFAEMRLIDEFQIIPEILKGFFLTVRQNYHDNPFHNWYHGFSVLHFSYLSLRVLTNASEYLTQHDVLALMIASLCHDIDHPGNTNSFEINTGSELALIHNDLSVLENHHSYTTFRILRQKSCNILCNLRKDTFQSLKKMIVGAIMATDMINHFSECRNLDKCDSVQPFNIKVPADRQVVVNLLIHSSDLSAQTFPTGVAKIWEERITREFENQAVREKSLGIAVAEFMQNLSNPVLRRQNQVNFIDVVLIPWWRATTRIFPGFKVCYKNLLINRNYYDHNADSVAPSPESMSSTVNSPQVQPPSQVQAPSSNTTEHKDGEHELELQAESDEHEANRNDQEEEEQGNEQQ